MKKRTGQKTKNFVNLDRFLNRNVKKDLYQWGRNLELVAFQLNRIMQAAKAWTNQKNRF